MLFADIALVAHRAEEMQSLLEKFARAASQFSLEMINIKMTECLYQPSKFQLSTSLTEEISIRTEPLVKCKSFKYLGSTVSDNARLEMNYLSKWEGQALCLETWGRDYGTIYMCLSV